MHGSTALIALGVGYLSYLQASKEKEGLKLLGQVIGIFVMIASLLSLFCSAGKCMMKNGYGYDKAPMCPMGKMSPDSQ